jgi:hypothetical protein
MLLRIKPYLLIALSFLMILLIQGQTHPNKATIHPNISLSEIKNYRSLIRVNDKPIDMEEATKFMCAYPGMIYGPHISPGIVYYINKKDNDYISNKGMGLLRGEKPLKWDRIFPKVKS